MVPVTGIEPATFGLQIRCSAKSELHWLIGTDEKSRTSDLSLIGRLLLPLSYTGIIWYRREGSNLRHHDNRSRTLPTELHRHYLLAGSDGVEPSLLFSIGCGLTVRRITTLPRSKKYGAPHAYDDFLTRQLRKLPSLAPTQAICPSVLGLLLLGAPAAAHDFVRQIA